LFNKAPDMNHDIKHFITTVITRAVLPALLLVAAVSFVTMPYTLGQHPGEAGMPPPATPLHMT